MNRVKRVIHATPAETAPFTGAGVTVALMDTGIAMHPDVAGRIVAFRDFLANSPRPYDDSGHGTHVAGCLCGSGYCSRGAYSGIAPGCRIVVCKVLDERGEGAVNDMISGIRYILDTRKLYRTRILNISVGVGKIENRRAQQMLLSCLEEAWNSGLLVVVAAGNRGPGAGTMSPLGYSPHVIAVGCHDGTDFPDSKNACENYSGRGPDGNLIRKPDIVSPGTGVVSCCADFKKNGWSSIRNAYTIKNGTSMAVPAVSGAAALLWQKYPFMTNAEIRDRLLWNAQDMGEPWGKQGWGMLHVSRALHFGNH